ncbi:MAG: DUF4936 family protein [Burkholderiales bacterium]|nr:DUF4936 family protein [Burkholderiales bacterium]
MSASTVYVYYKVADPGSSAARECVRGLLATVRLETGVQGRLLRRAEDPATWMEVYEDATRGDFAAVVERIAAASGIAAHLAPRSARVVERFEAF